MKLVHSQNYPHRGFTLIEILGAITVAAVLATVSVVTVQDTFKSGQRAAAQRELQHLNTALQNFRSAGGVIPAGASAEVAIDALQVGTNLSGSNFNPLPTRPAMTTSIGGEPYRLMYDPELGFSYRHGKDPTLAFAGSEVDAAMSLFAFTETGVSAGLDTFSQLNRGDEDYQIYLNALAIAMGLGDIPEELKAQIEAVLFDAGYLYDPELLAWEPIIPFDNEGLLALLAPERSTPEQDIAAFLAYEGASSPEQLALWWGFYVPLSQADIDKFLSDNPPESWGYASLDDWLDDWGASNVAELAAWTGFGTGDPEAMARGYGYSSFQELAAAWHGTFIPPDLTQFQIDRIASNFVDYSPEILSLALAYSPAFKSGQTFIDMQNTFAGAISDGSLQATGWTTAEIQDPLWVMFDNAARNNSGGQLMSQLDFSAINLTGKNLNGMNLANSNVSGAQLNTASTFNRANFSGLDLEGFSATGRNIWGVNFANSTGISVSDILTASDFRSTNLTGLDFTGASFTGRNINGVTISSPQNWDNGAALNGAADLRGAQLLGLDLTGYDPRTYINPTGSHTANINFTGSVLSQDGLNWMFSGGSAQMILRQSRFSGVDFTGVTITSDILWANLTGAVNLTGANFSRAVGSFQVVEANMGDIDMTGFPYDTRLFRGTDLRNVKNMTGADLNQSRGFSTHGGSRTNLSGRDLTGWSPTYPIINADLINVTGITAQSLVNATDIRGIRLTGTGITKAQLDAALLAVGKDPTSTMYNTASIRF